MKKIVLIFALLIFAASPTLAQETRVKPVRPLASGIQDRAKEVVMTRINAQMNKVNENMTNMWQKLIDRMQELADKLQTRLDTLSGEGKDVAAAQTALNEADAALITAENAVAAQAEKDYVIEFTDENGLRVGATTAKTALRADLKAVHDLVKAAREQLHEALVAAKEIAGEELEE